MPRRDHVSPCPCRYDIDKRNCTFVDVGKIGTESCDGFEDCLSMQQSGKRAFPASVYGPRNAT